MTTLKTPEAWLWLGPARRMASSIGAALGLVLLPKCPLCIAAYLVSFGVGAGAAHAAAPFIRPAAWVLMGVATLALVMSLRRFIAARSDSARAGAPAKLRAELKSAPSLATPARPESARCCCPAPRAPAP